MGYYKLMSLSDERMGRLHRDGTDPEEVLERIESETMRHGPVTVTARDGIDDYATLMEAAVKKAALKLMCAEVVERVNRYTMDSKPLNAGTIRAIAEMMELEERDLAATVAPDEGRR